MLQHGLATKILVELGTTGSAIGQRFARKWLLCWIKEPDNSGLHIVMVVF